MSNPLDSPSTYPYAGELVKLNTRTSKSCPAHVVEGLWNGSFRRTPYALSVQWSQNCPKHITRVNTVLDGPLTKAVSNWLLDLAWR